METLLEVRNLTKIFSKGKKTEYTAVNNVSFKLTAGETLGLVGESGSGKSTLAKLIARLIKPDSGSVFLNGKDITNLSGRALRDAYRQMQMVFQSPLGSFNPRKTIGFSIGESLLNEGVPEKEREQRVKELLHQCGLPAGFAERYPYEISGGQCQRAAVARALAIRPALLICDEATSALDVTVQQQIIDLLKQLKTERNLSFLFICHNLALVQSFCDRIMVMHDGKIVEEGTPDKVIKMPESEYTRSLVDAVF